MTEDSISNTVIARAIWTAATEAIRDNVHLFGIYIDGVEVTQAIQYRRAADHLSDPADRGPDNSIRLVADKAAYVRVYVRSTLQDVPDVSATVTVQRQRYGLWVDSGTLTREFPASITAERNPTYATERGSRWNSLNFIIPASLMRGHMRLKLRAESADKRYASDTSLDLDVSLLQTLRVRGIPVRYWGPDAAGNQVRLSEPTLADFQSTASQTLRMWPVARTPDITLAGVFTQSQPLTGNITVDPVTNQAVCPTSWKDLLLWLNVAKVLDGNRKDRLYFALMPNGIPIGQAGGCGDGGGVGSAFNGQGMPMAHELGHVLGFRHAPCGLVPGDMGDSNYPAYEPYDTPTNRQASIGEYGMDVTDGSLFSPNTSRDFMSYCANWISLYHYQQLLQNAALDPRWVSDPHGRRMFSEQDAYRGPVPHHIPDPVPPGVGRRVSQLAEPDPVPAFVLTGFLENERVEIRSVLRLETGLGLAGERVAGMRVELLDEQGVVIARAPLRRMAAEACGCGCDGDSDGDEPPSGVVQALLRDPRRGVTLKVVRDEETLWSRQAPPEPPQVSELNALVEGGDLVVRWSTSLSTSGETYIERALRWSNDEGRSWQMLAMNLDGDEAIAPLHPLPSGQILVQVLVSDGFNTTLSEPVAVEISPRAPQAAILAPTEGTTVRTDSNLYLSGMATASDGRLLEGEALQWEIDGERVGSGAEIWVTLPEWEGEHEAVLRASDGSMAGKASVTFMATNSGQRVYRRQDC